MLNNINMMQVISLWHGACYYIGQEYRPKEGEKMIRAHITMTGKSYSPKAKFSCFHEEEKTFEDMKEAMAWIKENYGKAKRVPMYQDTKSGGTKKVGYVIGFRNADMSHYPADKWIQQDWISFYECKPIYF